jgi:hypothetical protein
MGVRVTCSVRGCTRYRTREDGHWVWMCADHWRRIPKSNKRVWFRIERIRKRFGNEAVPHKRWIRSWRALAVIAGRLPPLTDIL